jgi:hypothetical protein
VGQSQRLFNYRDGNPSINQFFLLALLEVGHEVDTGAKTHNFFLTCQCCQSLAELSGQSGGKNSLILTRHLKKNVNTFNQIISKMQFDKRGRFFSKRQKFSYRPISKVS